MELSIQVTLLNVTDLERSLGFYQDVFELRLMSRVDQAAALMISEKHRRQVLVLRELESLHPLHGGRDSIGPRLVSFEAASLDELDEIERRLVERQAFVARPRTKTWETVVGVDPDRIELTVASSLSGSPIGTVDWTHLDEMVYQIGN
jgi:catechol 2,3-dioxygenase-like lactoylglutathione lyase family enzyme